ncbi:MAG: ribosome silencing factor [Oscillospiraceae bacterium]
MTQTPDNNGGITLTPLEIAKAAAKALDSKLGREIKIIKISDLTVLADYFVFASGNSATQVKALANEVDFTLGKLGVKALRTEGYDSGGWVLIDFNTVVVHVFRPETREFYSLERLWADGEEIDAGLEA